MEELEFLKKIEELDKAFHKIPANSRPYTVFSVLCPNYNGIIISSSSSDYRLYQEYEGPNLFEKIYVWYEKRYGKSVMQFKTNVGAIPLLIRHELYICRIPLVYGEPCINVLDLMVDITEDMISTLTPEECQYIQRSFEIGSNCIYDMINIQVHYIQSEKVKWYDLIDKAKNDLDLSVRAMRTDNANSCFHSQQHAEKMMKAYLIMKGVDKNKLKNTFKHDLKQIYDECVIYSKDFTIFKDYINLLSSIKMEIRYSDVSVPIKQAVDIFWASLEIGGLVAKKFNEK